MVGVTQYTLEQGALLGAHHLAFVGDFLSIALGNGIYSEEVFRISLGSGLVVGYD